MWNSIFDREIKDIFGPFNALCQGSICLEYALRHINGKIAVID